MDSLPQLSQLYSMLLKVEKQRNNGLVLIEHMNTLLAKMAESHLDLLQREVVHRVIFQKDMWDRVRKV